MAHQPIGLPQGFRDILFDEADRQRAIEQRVASVFAGQGFREIIPSTVEFLHLYERGHQHIQRRALKFIDRQDSVLALRADFTPAVARVIASRPLPSDLPLKVWYRGNVFRRVDPPRAPLAESWQAGAELFGGEPGEADALIIDLALRSLDELGIADAVVHLNHAGILGGLIDELHLEGDGLAAVQGDIDRKDARGLALRLRTLGIGEPAQQQVQRVARCTGGVAAIREIASTITAPGAALAVKALLALHDRLSQWEGRILFDLSERDDLEYYTGMMFSITHPKAPHELGKGGRYDGLLPAFGLDLPAVGFSLFTDRLRSLL
jgi:ATP phosphoribosyltransferase regulatory subunit